MIPESNRTVELDYDKISKCSKYKIHKHDNNTYVVSDGKDTTTVTRKNTSVIDKFLLLDKESDEELVYRAKLTMLVKCGYYV